MREMSVAVLQSTFLDFQNGSGTIAKCTAASSQFTFTGVSGAHVKVSGVATPTSANDAVNKNYVDSINFGGAAWLQPVEVATAVAGTLATSFAAGQVVDGYTLVAADRILIKDQADAVTNGVYVVQASGAPTRATDLAVGMNAGCSAVFAQRGTANADCSFVQTNNDSVVGTDGLAFYIFARPGEITAGAGLTRTANDIVVNVDDSTIEISADALRVKDAGITNAKLANSGVTVTAGSALTGGGAVALGASVTLDVAVDGSTIEVSSDALRVKDSGITTAKINDAAVTNVKLANSSVTVTAGSALTGGGAVALGASINLDVAVDDSTIEVSADALRVKDAGITNAKLANSSVTVTAGSALTGGGAVALGASINLDVAVDGSTIEVSADALRVKDSGITTAKINDAAVTNVKLANSSVTVTAGSALTGGGAVALGASINLDVAVDDSTIEVSADALRVKDAGITTAKINDAAVTNVKLANSSVTVTAGSALTGGGAVALGASINLDVAVDDSTIEVSADALRVKDAGITNAKLANSSVTVTAGSALTGGGAVALGASINLDVAVDGSTIEVSADALRVKDAGITNTKLANSSVTVTAGDGLASGGAVALGASVSLTVDSTVVRTTGAQSIGGVKTFTSAALVTDTTASTSYTTGCLKLSGGLGVAGKIFVNDEVSATVFNATSDETLKCDIAPISGALDTISRIAPVEFRFNFVENDKLHYGVLAQQLQDAGLGDIVKTQSSGSLAVEYNSLTGILLQAVKDLHAQVESLQARLPPLI